MKPVRALLAILGLSATMATAAPAFADDLAGDWLFETSTFDTDCMIKGVITFKKTQLSNTYSCTFQSDQICGPANVVRSIKVQQNCTAQKVGKQVAIKSEVGRIIGVTPAGYQPNYLADNFVLAISKSLNEMLGDHYDEVRQLKARFWRDLDLIS
jgi:hypothetical protein